MKFYIPAKGDKIRLLEDWQFRLFAHAKNSSFLMNILGYSDITESAFLILLKEAKYDIKNLKRKSLIKTFQSCQVFRHSMGVGGDFLHVVLPIGTIIEVESIGIRSNQNGLDHILFNIKDNDLKISGSFIVKISDVNRVSFEKFIAEDNSWVSDINECPKNNLLEI